MTDKLNDNQKEAIKSKIPTGRLGEASDIAYATLYLSSEEASYITGSTIHVNGGMAML
jgi:3-oxoacyl-[acyl-carrier protein] reductase